MAKCCLQMRAVPGARHLNFKARTVTSKHLPDLPRMISVRITARKYSGSICRSSVPKRCISLRTPSGDVMGPRGLDGGIVDSGRTHNLGPGRKTGQNV